MTQNRLNCAILVVFFFFVFPGLLQAQSQTVKVPAATSASGPSPSEIMSIREATQTLDSADAKTKEKALDQILASSYRDYSLVPQLLPLLKDASSQVRAQTVRLLGEVNDRKVTPEIINLCKDPVARVRQEAARSLALLEAREAIPDLIGLLSDDTEEVALEAVVGLQHFADERSVKGLTDVMVNGQSYRLRSAAIKALGDIRSSQPVSQLIVLLEYERDVWLRLDIARTLAKIGDDEALKPVMRYLDEVRQESNKQTDRRRKKVYSEIADEVEKLVMQIRRPSSTARSSSVAPNADSTTPTLTRTEEPKSSALPQPENTQIESPASADLKSSETVAKPTPGSAQPVPVKPKIFRKAKRTKTSKPLKKAKASAFTIQIKATKNTDLAHALVEDLKVKGEEAFLTEFQEGNETWYRVRVGSYASREAALAHAQSLKDKKIVEEFFVTR